MCLTIYVDILLESEVELNFLEQPDTKRIWNLCRNFLCTLYNNLSYIIWNIFDRIHVRTLKAKWDNFLGSIIQ